MVPDVPAQANSFVWWMVLLTAMLAAPWSIAGQAPGDSTRVRVQSSEGWTSGRLIRFDSTLVLRQSGQELRFPRTSLTRVEVYRRSNPLIAMAIGAGVALAAYTGARAVAGSHSKWACHGCGITWSEDRDYLLFGAGGLAAGLLIHASIPPRWRSIFER